MPIFEYECRDCGAEFEKLVLRAGDAPDAACPACASRKVEEKISSFASVVKGGSGAKASSCAPSG